MRIVCLDGQTSLLLQNDSISLSQVKFTVFIVNIGTCYLFTILILIVRLSLLTMTNPHQLCDVLLFVCSEMADETNLSSKLPVADRTREV